MLEYFTDPYPDEILYSTWARFSDQGHFSNIKDAFQELFGSRNVHPVVDLPCHLGNFWQNLPFGHAYTIDEFIDQHTLLPLYRPFLPPGRFEALRQQMIVGDGQAIHRRAGDINGRTPRIACLRYCPLCMQVDKETYGECYWHRLHQIPGVEICPVHMTFIESSFIQIRKPLAKKEFISAERTVTDYSCRKAELTSLHNTLIEVAKDISYLLTHHHDFLSHSFFREQYEILLAQHSFLTEHGLVRSIDLLNAFMDYYTPELLSRFNCNIQTKQAYNSWLARLVGGIRDVHPPLHHLLTIHFLGSTAEAFFHQDIEPAPIFGEGPWPCLNPVCEHYQQRSIHTYKIANTYKKGSKPAIFTCQCGFSYLRYGPDHSVKDAYRKDKVLSYGPIWVSKLRELWFNPAVTRRYIARYLGIAEQTVTRHAMKLHLPLPRISPVVSGGGRPRSRDATWYRTQWLALLRDMPEAGITALAHKAPGTYKWLIVHDREWLRINRPQLHRAGGRRKRSHLQTSEMAPATEDRKSNDVYLADQVKSAAQQIIAAPGPPKRVSIRAICTFVPKLFYLRGKPSIIPLTMQALEEVAETREAFAVRRIHWVAKQYQEKQIYPSRSKLVQNSHVGSLLHVPCVQQALEEVLDMFSQFA